jgi:hypothetical protein
MPAMSAGALVHASAAFGDGANISTSRAWQGAESSSTKTKPLDAFSMTPRGLKVEMPGVEPGSEWTHIQASTCVANLLEVHPSRRLVGEARPG